MATHDPSHGYTPPDPLVIEDNPDAYRYWAAVLEVDESRLHEAVKKAGFMVEHVKQTLGISGAG